MARLTFHGAAGCVTGSKMLLEASGERLLVDCGMFQGAKTLRERNWSAPPFDARSLKWVVLTHAHIDHTGWLPRLYASGFRGRVLATPATVELAQLLLIDAARLQEEDADFLNKKGATKHQPALPLYTERDARNALALFEAVPYGVPRALSSGLSFRFVQAGHLLGSAMVEVRVGARAWGKAEQSPASSIPRSSLPSGEGPEVKSPEVKGRAPAPSSSQGSLTIVFSGDVGRYGAPLAPDPDPPASCDVLVMESTYGDRPHGTENVQEALAQVAERTFRRGGVLLVPSFAVGRAQQVIFVLRSLYESGRLPRAPIFVDSPMAVDATGIYARHAEELDRLTSASGSLLAGPEVRLCRSREESKGLNSFQGPGVIISSSGMLTGGRILHHLARRLPDPKTTVLLVGYQAEGTRGRALSEGARYLRFHGEEVEVRAEVAALHGMSGHADTAELLRWTAGLAKPRTVFLTHGEPDAARALAESLRRQKGWDVLVPELHQSFEIEERPA